MCSKLLSVIAFILSRRCGFESVCCFFITTPFDLLRAGNCLWTKDFDPKSGHRTETAAKILAEECHQISLSLLTLVCSKIKTLQFPKKKLFAFLIFELCLTKVSDDVWRSFGIRFAIQEFVCVCGGFRYLLINYGADFIAIVHSYFFRMECQLFAG